MVRAIRGARATIWSMHVCSLGMEWVQILRFEVIVILAWCEAPWAIRRSMEQGNIEQLNGEGSSGAMACYIWLALRLHATH